MDSLNVYDRDGKHLIGEKDGDKWKPTAVFWVSNTTMDNFIFIFIPSWYQDLVRALSNIFPINILHFADYCTYFWPHIRI